MVTNGATKVPTSLLGEIRDGRVVRNALVTFMFVAASDGKATPEEIAARMHWSVRTVRKHIRQLKKVGAL